MTKPVFRLQLYQRLFFLLVFTSATLKQVSHRAAVFEDQCFHRVRAARQRHERRAYLSDRNWLTKQQCSPAETNVSKHKHRASIDPAMIQEEVEVLIWFHSIAHMIRKRWKKKKKNCDGAIKTKRQSTNGLKESPTRTVEDA